MSGMDKEIEQFIQEVLRRKPKIDLEHLVEGYRLCARSEGKSASTIALVEAAVRYLGDFLKDSGMPTDVKEIGIEQLRRFNLHLQDRQRFAKHPFTKPQGGHLSGHTINGYMRALRAFWSWLEAEGFIERNPFSVLKIAKVPRRVIPTFSAEQLASLIEAIDGSTPEGYRNYAIVLLLADSMLRVSELTRLKLDDVNLERRVLKVWGKGAKERLVPFGVRVQRALWRYVNFQRPEPAGPRIKEFFLTQSGQPLKKRRVEAIIKAYGEKAGIQGVRCSPHTLRHTAAVMWIRNGGDVFSLQQILGHSTLDIVRIYVNLAQSDIETAHRIHSPADNLELKAPRVQRVRK